MPHSFADTYCMVMIMCCIDVASLQLYNPTSSTATTSDVNRLPFDDENLAPAARLVQLKRGLQQNFDERERHLKAAAENPNNVDRYQDLVETVEEELKQQKKGRDLVDLLPKDQQNEELVKLLLNKVKKAVDSHSIPVDQLTKMLDKGIKEFLKTRTAGGDKGCKPAIGDI